MAEGDTLVRQGDPGTEVFLILDGMFVVEIDGKEVAEIGPGAVVGELASLANGTRTATLWARTKARVAGVPPDALDSEALGSLAATRTHKGSAAQTLRVRPGRARSLAVSRPRARP